MSTRHACSRSTACFSTGRICVTRVFQSSLMACTARPARRERAEARPSFIPTRRRVSMSRAVGTAADSRNACGKRLPCTRMNRASEVAAAEDAAPFSLGPATAQAGALLVHGFTGSPFEMRLLGEHLAARGLAVEGPLLPGHRSTTAALAATGWRDWLAGVERAFEKLQSRAPRVAVCGLSLGGLLTLELARRRASTGE